MKKLLLIVVILVCLLFGYLLYHQSQSHSEDVEKIKENNQKIIKEMERQFQEEKDIMNHVIIDREGRIMELNWDVENLNEYLGVHKIKNNIVTAIEQAPKFVVTAYDLSIQSCQKPFSSRSYGITANGTNLKGLDLRSASTISVDPTVIPLGTIVYLYFIEKNAKQYNGLYISNDTGSAIKGNKIDLYFGDFNSEKASLKAMQFGRKTAKVIKLE